ncbi:fibronectin type III domain-containing protein [Pseudomonas wadenswilerensis]
MAAHAQSQGSNNDPSITSAIYDGSSVRATWTPSADTGVTGYVIQLFWLGGGDPVLAYQSQVFEGRITTVGNLPLTQPLNTDVAYQVVVQAQWGSTAGQFSPPVVLPTARPTLTSARYDGKALQVEWQPSWQAAGGYQIVVLSKSIGTLYTIAVSGAQTTSAIVANADLGGGLGDNAEWVVSVAAVGENSASARSDQAQFPVTSMVRPVLAKTNLYRNGDQIVARWTGSGASEIVGYTLSASAVASGTRYSIEVAGGNASSATLPLPAALAASENYQLSVTAWTASGAGLVSPLVPIVSTRPLLVAADYNGSSLTLGWTIPYNPAVTGYTLQALSLSSGQSLSATVSDPAASSGSITLSTPLDTAQRWVAQVIANAGDGVGAEGELLPLVTGSATFSSLVVGADSIDISWQPAVSLVAADSTTVSLLLDGSVARSISVNGNSARLSLPVSTGTPALSVSLVPARGAARNSSTAALVAPTAIPQISGWDTDAVSASGTLGWAALAGAPGYRLGLPGGQHLDLSTTSTTLTPAQLGGAGVPALVTLRSAGVVNGCTLIGPASAPFALATTTVSGVEVSYDGATLSARWSAVPEGQSYRISVLKSVSGSTSVDQAFTSSPGVLQQSWAYAPSNADATLSVVVQANQAVNGVGNIGPSSLAQALYGSAFIPSAQAASTSFPHLIPAQALSTALSGSAPTQALTLYLPQIGKTGSLSGLPITQGPFTLAAATGNSWSYSLSIASSGADSPWTFDTQPIRPALLQAYVAFLKALETAGAAAWGIIAVQDALARVMPQTFEESLYYAFGLSFPSSASGATLGSVDLRPGMILRVAASPFQTISQSSSLPWSNGYVAGPLVDYEVGQFVDSSGNISTGWDSFIGQLVSGGALSVNAPPSHSTTEQMGGVADAADLYFPAFITPFYRLFAPTSLASASNPAPTDTPSNFTLAAATSFTALSSASNLVSGTLPVAYFRGRVVPKACLRVTLDGTPLVVPVGTTVANLLAQAGRMPMAAPLPVQGVRVLRGLGAAVLDPTAAPGTTAWPLRLDWSGLGSYAPGWTPLSLPLLPGDSVSTRQP